MRQSQARGCRVMHTNLYDATPLTPLRYFEARVKFRVDFF